MQQVLIGAASGLTASFAFLDCFLDHRDNIGKATYGFFERIAPHRELDIDLMSSLPGGTKHCWKGTDHEADMRIGSTGAPERGLQSGD